MLLHNLYYLNSDENLPQYVNYIDRKFTADISIIQFLPSPYIFGAFETFTADNTIFPNADVVYNASELIVLKPGFQASNGATFHAEIKPVLCGANFYKSNIDSLQSSMGLTTISEKHIYQNLSDKFAHLYELPDTISIEDLQKHYDRMNELSKYENVNETNIRQSFAEISLMPNPAIDFIEIKFEGFENLVNFQIYDIDGKVIKQGSLYNAQHINLKDFSSGIYLIKVFDDAIFKTQKFIKN